MSLFQTAAALLLQLRAYLSVLTPQQYQGKSKVLLGSSIGEHTRHLLEFFQCLLLQAAAEPRQIDYAARERDPRLEADPAFALAMAEQLALALQGLSGNPPCRVSVADVTGEEGAPTVPSCLEREILYNIEHTIHHLAIIRIGLGEAAPGLELPEDFGVARSTLSYKAQERSHQNPDRVVTLAK